VNRGYFTSKTQCPFQETLLRQSLELIAEEIEDPFGDDVNDLPMEKIAENITGNVQEILGIHREM
jgi:predicted membrane chloride channel (bestrophin family)